MRKTEVSNLSSYATQIYIDTCVFAHGETENFEMEVLDILITDCRQLIMTRY